MLNVHKSSHAIIKSSAFMCDGCLEFQVVENQEGVLTPLPPPLGASEACSGLFVDTRNCLGHPRIAGRTYKKCVCVRCVQLKAL